MQVIETSIATLGPPFGLMHSGMETPGDRLRERRKLAKLSQRKLAIAVDITKETVSLHELNKVTMSAAIAARYAKLFGVTVDYLLNGSGAAVTPATAPAREGTVSPMAVSVPMPVARLLSDGRCNPVTDNEIVHLAKYLAEGGSPELAELELALLIRRAERERTPENVERLSAALLRHPGAADAKVTDVRPVQPTAATKAQKKPQLTR